jgi:hypothetical protein
MEDFLNDMKDHEKASALSELTQWKAIKVLIENNDLGCEIHIAGMHLGIVDNSKLLPVVNQNITEIKKYLKGQTNLWE